MAKRTAKPNIMDELMNEHIELPGCPQIIVTRAWAAYLLSDMGYQRFGGFASVDYMAFGPQRRAVDLPLTDLDLPEVQSVLALMREHAA